MFPRMAVVEEVVAEVRCPRRLMSIIARDKCLALQKEESCICPSGICAQSAAMAAAARNENKDFLNSMYAERRKGWAVKQVKQSVEVELPPSKFELKRMEEKAASLLGEGTPEAKKKANEILRVVVKFRRKA